jgi:thymidine phosphorylase
VAKGDDDARSRLAAAIATGAAAQTAERMIRAQGGDPRVVTEAARLEIADVEVPVESAREGVVTQVDALGIGLAAVAMGAGRTRADQKVDHAVGIYVDARPGTRVAPGQPLARLRVRTKGDAAGIVERVAESFVVGDAAPPQRPLVLGRIPPA